MTVRIIAIKTLKEFWKKYPDSEQPLRAWYSEAINADWKKPNDITKYYRTASILSSNRVVFNIAGNNYRMICKYILQKIKESKESTCMCVG